MSTQPDRELIAAIRAGLRAHADPERAAGQQRYMRSTQPFYGVRVPEVRRIARVALKERPPASQADLICTVRALWDDAEFREDRYAALALLGAPAVRRLIDLELVPTLEYLITTGAWWDLVDEIAHRVADLRNQHPERIAATLREWARSPDLWLRRSAIIAQLRAGDRTDTELLSEVILANTADKDFFIRKAIGWALRDYAGTAPGWVREFVTKHHDDLNNLSIREATKHL